MKMKSIAGIIFLVEDLDKTIGFYEAVGFDFKKQTAGVSATGYLNWFWIEFLLKDKVVTEAFKEDIDVDNKGAGAYIHINVENVDDFHKSIVDKHIQPLSEPDDFPWGHREFVLEDPDGYKLVFFTKN